jgi:hypothetical protein
MIPDLDNRLRWTFSILQPGPKTNEIYLVGPERLLFMAKTVGEE